MVEKKKKKKKPLRSPQAKTGIWPGYAVETDIYTWTPGQEHQSIPGASADSLGRRNYPIGGYKGTCLAAAARPVQLQGACS